MNYGWTKTDDFLNPKRILVRTPNWLGDVLMATAFLDALLTIFPKVPIDLIVRQGFEVLPLPVRGEIIPFDRKVISPGAFGRKLWNPGGQQSNEKGSLPQPPNYSHFFVLPPSFSAAWMAYRSRIPYRMGYRGDGRGWLLHPGMRHTHTPRSVHLVREYLDLLQPWGQASEQTQPRLAADEAWILQHLPSSLAESDPYIVLAPGAEFGPAKQWPVTHFQAAAKTLAQAGWRVVVTGLPQDRGHGDTILAGVKDGLNLCGETSLQGLTALLGQAELVISNDSGAMHLTAALHRPQVALFGSSNPVWTAPLNPQAHILTQGLTCSPCYKRTCPLGHTRCLTEITPDEVTSAAMTLLS